MANLSRRSIVQLAASAATLSASPRVASSALDYPTRPVRIIVGFPPGGPTDILGRLIGEWLTERFRQPFIIESRPGAAGNVGTEMVVRAPADGYTLLLFGAEAAVNATLYDNLSFNFIRDIAPVAGIMHGPDVMMVNPSFPAKTVLEFIAYAKANPGKINMGTPGNGTPPHMFGELFKIMTGTDLVPVAYRGGGPALVDLLSGRTQVEFMAITAAIEHVKTGKLRALAVTSASRSTALPEVPTVGEFVPGYEASVWFGVGVPKKTPSEIVGKLNSEIGAGLADPGIKERFANLGSDPMPLTPTEFNKLIADETEKWGRVVKSVGIKLD